VRGASPTRGARLRRSFVRSALGLALFGMAAPIAGQGVDPRAEMTRTVLDQLAAFRRDDWATAYTYASSGIQARFALEAFRQMVTTGYAPIARSARATVSRVEVLDASHGLVEVRVEGANGEIVDALYELVDEQGSWRIEGVLIQQPVGGATAERPGAASPLSVAAG
jgi:Domain of unknown function (DUF4864)